MAAQPPSTGKVTPLVLAAATSSASQETAISGLGLQAHGVWGSRAARSTVAIGS